MVTLDWTSELAVKTWILGDLPTIVAAAYLQEIFQGIKKDLGDEAATNFAGFVAGCEDFSRSAFTSSFEQFWSGKCQEMNEAHHEPADSLDPELLLEGPSELAKQRKAEAVAIKREFLKDHFHEVPIR